VCIDAFAGFSLIQKLKPVGVSPQRNLDLEETSYWRIANKLKLKASPLNADHAMP
jgi:hypothetical protein